MKFTKYYLDHLNFPRYRMDRNLGVVVDQFLFPELKIFSYQLKLWWQGEVGTNSAFLDSLFFLLNARTIRDIQSMDFKEWQNYLSDGPTQTVWDTDDSLAFWQNQFLQVKLWYYILPTPALTLPPYHEFKILGLGRQILWLERFLNEMVRPVLARDQGGINLLDIDLSKNIFILKLSEACQQCPHRNKTTLDFLQSTFRQALSYSDLKVILEQ